MGGYGRVLRHRQVQLDLDMDCEQPYGFELHARYSAVHRKKVQPITVIVMTRCRQCWHCKRRRSMFWTGRAMTEYQLSERTIFGTFTLSPEQHYQLDAAAHVRLHAKRVGFADLSPQELFAERARQFGFELQLYLKRLRKGNLTHAPIEPRECSYLLVAEAHDSEKTSPDMRMRPHFHILFHEKRAGALIQGDPALAIARGPKGEGDGEWQCRMVNTRKGWQPMAFARDEAFIRQNWTLGFTKFQWASSANSAVYVCKYLNKALTYQVRASQRYGRDPNDLIIADRATNTEGNSDTVVERSNIDPQRTD